MQHPDQLPELLGSLARQLLRVGTLALARIKYLTQHLPVATVIPAVLPDLQA